MIPALLASVFFALSGVCGQRSTRGYGALRANFFRLALACLVLAAVTLAVNRDSFSPAVSGWLGLSGLIGFGIGDVALYLAYAKIGSRMTFLIYLCSAPVFAAAADWVWLGTRVSGVEWAAMCVILGGVLAAFVRSPKRLELREEGNPLARAGVWWAILAGCGQGLGATVSRVADAVAKSEGLEVGGFSMAFQRVFAGMCFGAVVFLVSTKVVRAAPRALPISHRRWWLLGAALFGPVAGVSCFQWALIAGTPSAVVLAVTAISPLLIIPLAYLTENDRPRKEAVVGSAIAVAGVVWLCLGRDAG